MNPETEFISSRKDHYRKLAHTIVRNDLHKISSVTVEQQPSTI